MSFLSFFLLKFGLIPYLLLAKTTLTFMFSQSKYIRKNMFVELTSFCCIVKPVRNIVLPRKNCGLNSYPVFFGSVSLITLPPLLSLGMYCSYSALMPSTSLPIQ